MHQLAALLAQGDGTGEWSTADVRGDHRSAASRETTARSRSRTSRSASLVPTTRRWAASACSRLLGEGGQGAVYRAQDTASGSIVALKVLRTERAGRPEALKRFRKEARLLAEANNPHVVNLLEFNEDDRLPYLVLEFVAGRTLGDLITEQTRLDEPSALEIMADVARALAGPHERGIVHRDVKPANILLPDSGTTRPRDGRVSATIAMDGEPVDGLPPTIAVSPGPAVVPRQAVGLRAGSARRRLAVAGDDRGRAHCSGTPHYMAPEQWNGLASDARTDVYAMGATLFQMLAGRPPFVGETRDELLTQHCQEPVPPLGRFNPAVSEGTMTVVARAMAKRPEDRYPDAGAMLRDLEALRRGTPTAIAIHPQLPRPRPARSSRSTGPGSWRPRPASSGPTSPTPSG